MEDKVVGRRPGKVKVMRRCKVQSKDIIPRCCLDISIVKYSSDIVKKGHGNIPCQGHGKVLVTPNRPK